MDEQTYILALRSKLQKPTIFWNEISKIYIKMHIGDWLVNFGNQILIHNSY
jgi:hypothetical protein